MSKNAYNFSVAEVSVNQFLGMVLAHRRHSSERTSATDASVNASSERDTITNTHTHTHNVDRDNDIDNSFNSRICTEHRDTNPATSCLYPRWRIGSCKRLPAMNTTQSTTAEGRNASSCRLCSNVRLRSSLLCDRHSNQCRSTCHAPQCFSHAARLPSSSQTALCRFVSVLCCGRFRMRPLPAASINCLCARFRASWAV